MVSEVTENEFQDIVLKKLSNLEGHIGNLEGQIGNLEGQMSETNQVVKALLHQSEVQKAQIDQVIHATSRIEGDVKGLRSDINTIEAVTAKNWNDIVKLKTVKQA